MEAPLFPTVELDTTVMIDPITDSDLAAFVDGQLDVMRRLEVESHLGRTPEAAARVMAEMHDRDALRQAFSQLPGPGPERNRAAARRLDRSMAWRRVGERLKRAAVIVLLVGAGWIAHSDTGVFGVPDTFAAPVDPALVADARQAREVAQIRVRLGSPASPSYDKAGISGATGIVLPDLPGDWSVRDVQIVPARHGAGVEVVINTPDLGEISLFAARGTNEAAFTGEVTSPGDGETVYWTAGRSVYALSGTGRQDALQQAARRLASIDTAKR
jgi:anti-sigma factor RsiW